MIDPKTGQPSVSLSLLAISFTIAAGAIIMNILKYTDNTSASTDLFFGCAALYFSRKMNINGKSFSSDNSTTSDKQ